MLRCMTSGKPKPRRRPDSIKTTDKGFAVVIAMNNTNCFNYNNVDCIKWIYHLCWYVISSLSDYLPLLQCRNCQFE